MFMLSWNRRKGKSKKSPNYYRSSFNYYGVVIVPPPEGLLPPDGEALPPDGVVLLPEGEPAPVPVLPEVEPDGLLLPLDGLPFPVEPLVPVPEALFVPVPELFTPDCDPDEFWVPVPVVFPVPDVLELLLLSDGVMVPLPVVVPFPVVVPLPVVVPFWLAFLDFFIDFFSVLDFVVDEDCVWSVWADITPKVSSAPSNKNAFFMAVVLMRLIVKDLPIFLCSKFSLTS